MNVLSLFDGISCGQQALDRCNIKVKNYYASEIDKYAIKITMANYPNTIQLGSVTEIDGNILSQIDEIDLLIGGSPCQSFSFAGKRKGMSTKCNQEIYTLEKYLKLKDEDFEFEGQSYLFWEFVRLLKEVKPKYFLLENVMMEERWENLISKTLGVKPIEINSSLVSAQNRKRLYWTNIGMKPMGLFGFLESIIEQPKDKGILLKDILEDEVDEKYFLSEKFINYLLDHNKRHIEKGTCFIWQPKDGNNKANTIRANGSLNATDNTIIDFKIHSLFGRTSKNGNGGSGHLYKNGDKSYCLDTANSMAIELHSKVRKLTPVECERLQTINDNYTNYVSDSQRYKSLGNGWTIDVIAHIFSYLNK